jgi:hypothetical protein
MIDRIHSFSRREFMHLNLINIGFNNQIAADRILAIIIPDAAPTRRMILAARKAEKLIDASYGRKTRSVLVMDNGFVVLSSVQPETLVARLKE